MRAVEALLLTFEVVLDGDHRRLVLLEVFGVDSFGLSIVALIEPLVGRLVERLAVLRPKMPSLLQFSDVEVARRRHVRPWRGRACPGGSDRPEAHLDGLLYFLVKRLLAL